MTSSCRQQSAAMHRGKEGRKERERALTLVVEKKKKKKEKRGGEEKKTFILLQPPPENRPLGEKGGGRLHPHPLFENPKKGGGRGGEAGRFSAFIFLQEERGKKEGGERASCKAIGYTMWRSG